MKKYILSSLVSLGMACNGFAEGVPPLQKIESAHSPLFIQKVQVDGHTYIHFINGWNGTGDAFLHDPACPECDTEEEIRLLVDVLKREFPPREEGKAFETLVEEIKRVFPPLEKRDIVKEVKDKKADKKKKSVK